MADKPLTKEEKTIIFEILVNHQHIMDEILRGFNGVAQEMPKLVAVQRKTHLAQDASAKFIASLKQKFEI